MLRETSERRPLVTASAGNHGRALAFAADALDLPLTVFIASDAPRTKLDAIRATRADLRLAASYDEAERQAKVYATHNRARYISPYSDPDVIAGAGTILPEILEDLPSVETVVAPVGGGGLISGIGIAAKVLAPAVRVIGVEVAASCPFTKSLAAGRVVPIDVGPSLADGLTGNLDPDTITFDIVRNVVDGIEVVQEPDIRQALSGVLAHEHLVIEGAAAAGLAPLTSGQLEVRGRQVAAILTGANIDADRLRELVN
jgi:threonine dehydratase